MWHYALPQYVLMPTRAVPAHDSCRTLSPAGLDIDKDTIIEIACLVTDGDLRQVVEVKHVLLGVQVWAA